LAKAGGFAKHDINFKTKEMAFKWYAGKSDTYIYEGDADSKPTRDAEVTPTKTPEKDSESSMPPTPKSKAKPLIFESEEKLRGND